MVRVEGEGYRVGLQGEGEGEGEGEDHGVVVARRHVHM
jgi:hypothetical protein